MAAGAGQGRAEQGRAGQGRAEQSSAEQRRAEQSSAAQSRAEQSTQRAGSGGGEGGAPGKNYVRVGGGVPADG